MLFCKISFNTYYQCHLIFLQSNPGPRYLFSWRISLGMSTAPPIPHGISLYAGGDSAPKVEDPAGLLLSKDSHPFSVAYLGHASAEMLEPASRRATDFPKSTASRPLLLYNNYL